MELTFFRVEKLGGRGRIPKEGDFLVAKARRIFHLRHEHWVVVIRLRTLVPETIA
jgi:hypothetical protein